jgi:hypothetical protein
MLDTGKSHPPNNETLNDLSHQIQELLERVQMGSTKKIWIDGTSSKQELSDGFVTSILRAAKPGMSRRIKS